VNSLRLICPSPFVSSCRKRESVEADAAPSDELLPPVPEPNVELDPFVPVAEVPVPAELPPVPEVPEPVVVDPPVPAVPLEPDEVDGAAAVAARARAVAIERIVEVGMFLFMAAGTSLRPV
jgi:hypothetical protein